ncbi:MAG: DUF3175 domain-containing protein [Candidatus Acidiferrales bacterium]
MKRTNRSSSQSHQRGRAGKRWVAGVTTDSTHPPPGLFTKSASTIARVLASKKVSPKGPQSGMRMLNYFINRGGRGLTRTRRAELEKAKSLLSKKIARSKASAN